MPPTASPRRPRTLRPLAALALPAAVLQAGCGMIVLDPAGDVAAQQGRLIVIATVLMLLIVVPVIALTLLFAWRYRAANREADYQPDWDHSTALELVIWAAPLLIIIALGAVTWITTHTLDPYRVLKRIDASRPVPAGVEPLEVRVVALDWKWLFIYPEHGVATVNELAAPVDRPIRFKLTSSSVMNAFYVPALAGMIYAMPGMETTLHAVINQPGNWPGFSANYSGDGFSHMRFRFHGLAAPDFDAWVARVRGNTDALTRAVYLKLEQPSEREPARHFGRVAPDLWDAIVNRCVDATRMCMNQMMAIDAGGGLGKPGIDGVTTAALPGRGGATRRSLQALACRAGDPFDLDLVASN